MTARAEDAARQIRGMISLGRLTPGQKIQEVSAAAELGVSRNTLREAFAMLTAEGTLDRQPNRGVFVTVPTPAEVSQLFDARAIVEPAAILWGEHLNAEAISAIVAEARAELASRRLAAVADANQRFHQQLFDAAPALSEFTFRMLAKMRLVFLLVVDVCPDFHAEYVEVNARLAELIADGQRGAAAEELRVELGRTSRRICSLLSGGDA